MTSTTIEGRRSVDAVAVAVGIVWVVWGSTYLAIAIGRETIPPFALQGARFWIAGGLLYAWARSRGETRPRGAEARHAAVVGNLLLVGGLGLVTLAEDHGAGSGLAATMIAVSPMWLALWNRIWGPWPGRREWIGMGLGLVAIAVLGLSGDTGTSAVGLVLLALSPVAWTFGSAWSQHVSMPPGAMGSAWQMLAAATTYTVLTAVAREPVAVPSVRSSLALIYLALIGAIVAYSAYQYLLVHARPAVATSYAYVNPIVAVVLGVALNGEALTPSLLVALPLVVGSVVLITRRPGADELTRL